MRDTPDWTALPPDTPPRVRALIARCLERDVKLRLRDIGEARIEIAKIESGASQIATAPTAASPGPAPTSSLWKLAATALLTALVVGIAVWRISRPAATTPPLVRSTVLLPELSSPYDLALSNTHVAFVTGPEAQLFIRALNAYQATPIAGATRAVRPFFSPDGQWLAYYSAGDRRLKKVLVAGGLATDICDLGVMEGAAWGPAGIVVVVRAQGMTIVSPDGGAPPRQVLAAGKSTFFQDPIWLPDGRTILYTEVGRLGLGDQDLSVAKVMTVSLESGATPTHVIDGYAGRFVAPHALLFERNNALASIRFDPSSRIVSGGAETLETDVSAFAVSPSGAVVIRPLLGQDQLTFVWADRQNHIEPTGIPPQPYRYPRISPDGTRIVMASSANDRDLWIWDLRQKALTRLTTEKGADSYPVWTPDSRRVIYAGATQSTDENIMIRSADGTGGPEPLLTSDRHQTPYTVSPDGAFVVFRDEVPGEGTNLDILDVRTREAKPLLATKFNERDAEISPDGHLLAYQSDETGIMEVYVRPFPNVDGGKKVISNGGGARPAWSHDGQRLYYMTRSVPPATMNVVERQVGAALDFGPPAVVFDAAPFANTGLLGRTYDVSADGRFFMPKSTGDTSAPAGLLLILNLAQHLGANR
jgi:serine/threonine-protein kinase